MNYRGLIILSWSFRILAVLVALGTVALTIIGIQTAATLARIAAEHGMPTTSSAYEAVPLLLGGLFLALILYTVGALLALLVDMAIAQRETADALARMRRRQ